MNNRITLHDIYYLSYGLDGFKLSFDGNFRFEKNDRNEKKTYTFVTPKGLLHRFVKLIIYKQAKLLILVTRAKCNTKIITR